MNINSDLNLSLVTPTLDDLNLLGAFLGNQHYNNIEVAAQDSVANNVPVFIDAAQPEESDAGALRYTPIQGL